MKVEKNIELLKKFEKVFCSFSISDEERYYRKYIEPKREKINRIMKKLKSEENI